MSEERIKPETTFGWFKKGLAFFLIFQAVKFLGVTFDFLTVGYTRFLSDVIGYLPEAVREFCANCLEAIG